MYVFLCILCILSFLTEKKLIYTTKNKQTDVIKANK